MKELNTVSTHRVNTLARGRPFLWVRKSTTRERNEGRKALYDSRESNGTLQLHEVERVRRPFVECVEVMITRNVLFDELLINRLCVHPLVERRGTDEIYS
jgi:hypothetical protein